MIKVPWDQLQYCDMGGCRVDRCVELLRLAPNLEACKMSFRQFALPNSTRPVQLSRLRSIIIRGDPSNLLDKLLVPELHEIDIHLHIVPLLLIKTLTSLFLRCSIQVLSIRSDLNDIHPSPDDMIQILQASPTLVRLELRGYICKSMTKSFLKQFASHSGPENFTAPRLVPILHTMKVDHSSVFNILEFADAIQSRMTLGALKKVEIHGDFFSTDIRSRLREMRDIDGLDIRACR